MSDETSNWICETTDQINESLRFIFLKFCRPAVSSVIMIKQALHGCSWIDTD